tara:strand:- start:95 stop:415 length:321 start_codon:yes stop_codon:yes gene_type:complete
MDGFLYCTATNSGKGFITHQDRHDFFIRGFEGNVWVVEKNIEGAAWISRVSGTSKTYTEAQAIVDTLVTNAQNAWDADNEDGESAEEKVERIGSKPTDTKLPFMPS